MFIRYLRTILIFYRGLWVPSGLVTLFSCLAIFYISINQIRDHKEFYGVLMFTAPFFWIKTFTNLLMLLYLIKFKAHEMYFYANLGVRKRELMMTAFLIDYLLFFSALFLVSLCLKLPLISR
ncbi:MAG: hypothetical protein NTW31_11830 [Bacteroidetes bacterium]|nr:hypothetical protein [Bacteroidota bacterium]